MYHAIGERLGWPRCLILVLAACCAARPAAAQNESDWTLSGVRQMIDTALRNDLIRSEPPRFFFEADAVWVNWGTLEERDLVETRLMEVEVPPPEGEEAKGSTRGERLVAVRDWRLSPLRMMVLVQQIRRTRNSPEQQKTWSPYLARAESLIEKQLKSIRDFEREHPDAGQEPGQMSAAEKSLRDALVDYEDAIFRVFYAHLDRVAEARGQVVRLLELDTGTAVIAIRDGKEVLVMTPQGSANRYYLRIVTGDPIEIQAGAANVEAYFLSEFQYWRKGRGKPGAVPEIDQWEKMTRRRNPETGAVELACEASGKGRVLLVWPDQRKTVESINLAATDGGAPVRRFSLSAQGKLVAEP